MEDDELDRRLREEAEAERRQAAAWAEHYRIQQRDTAIIAWFGGFCVLTSIGLAGWLLWGYLQTGTWPTMSLRKMLGWSFSSEMVGLANIINWFLDLWWGFYPLGLGLLLLSATLDNL